jgi:outer membrane lipoprotein LolB
MRFVIVLLVLLSGCSTLPDINVAESVWRPQREKLTALHTWQLNAALAAHSKDDGFDARLFWRQEQEIYRLRLHGPLGQGTVLIDGDASGVRLRTGEQREYRAHDPETLLAQLTDITLPVSHLKYWIRGLPAPTPVVVRERFYADGSLALLEQDGWEIKFLQYHEDKDYALPRRLELKNSEFFIRLVISNWVF